MFRPAQHLRAPTPRTAITLTVALLTGLGVPVTPGFVNGGHNWYAWRLNLRDFLTRTAFFPPVAG